MQKQPEVLMIPISKIVPDPEQPRKNFDAARMAELMSSISDNGILSPLIVEKFPDGTYLIEDGERRYRAAKELGLKEVPAYITEPKKGIERLVMQFHLQEQKQGWTAVEKATAVFKLAEEMKISAAQVAKLLALPVRSISSYIAFASLIERKRFEKEEIPLDFAERITSIKKTINNIYTKQEEKFTKDTESAIENAVIVRVKRGEFKNPGQVSKLADIAKQDLAGFKKLLENDKTDVEEVFASSDAKPYRIHVGTIYTVRRLKAMLIRGLPLNFEKQFTRAEKEEIKVLSEQLNDLVRAIG